MPDRHGMADKFHQNRFCALQSPVYLARQRGRCLHLLDFTHYRHFLRRGTGMPRLLFLTCGAQAADFAMPESAASVTSCSASAGQFSTHRQDRFRALQKVAFMRRGFTFLPQRVSERFASYQMDRPPRRIYSQYTLLIDLNAVINVADCAIRAATGAGRIFTMVTGHCTTLLLMFDNRNSGMKMVLAQDMLLVIVSHDTGDFTKHDNPDIADCWP